MELFSINLLKLFVLNNYCIKGEREKMRKETATYILVALTAIMLVSMFSTISAYGFIYPDGSTDDSYEFYGPHADKILVSMYEGTGPEWIALEGGQIDLTDEPVDTVEYARLTSEPYASNISIVSAGGEAGYYPISFNFNTHPTMGQIFPYVENAVNKYGVDDPDGRPNPVYINDSAYWAANHIVFPPISSNVYFRLGFCDLFDRATYAGIIGSAGVQMLTPVPVYMGKYSLGGYYWDECPGYPYSTVLANANFTAGRIFLDGGSGKRYWDLNGDNIPQTAEFDAAKIIFYYRSTPEIRKRAGIMLTAELIAQGFDVSGGMVNGGQNYQYSMLDKNYHISTFGWIFVGPEPDYLYGTYHIAQYWDSEEESCGNSAAINDTVLNDESKGIMNSLTPAIARAHTYNFQVRFYQIAAELVLACNNAFKAMSKYYTGGDLSALNHPDDGENQYSRVDVNNDTSAKRAWLDACNQAGFGSNSWFSKLNMLPDKILYGTNGLMTIRYGWSETAYPQHVNPYYSEWYWDSEVLSPIYDTLGYRDPYNLPVWKGDIAKSWQVGTWLDGTTVKSKVTVTIRTDAYFQDGTPITLGDIIWSLVDSGKALIANGYTPPWWWAVGSQVRSLSIIDAYTVEILYNSASYLVEGWTLGGFYIVPKHIWKPIIDGVPGHRLPTDTAPDQNLVGSGPYRLSAWIPHVSLEMVANKPLSTVKINAPAFPDSTPLTSPIGYHAYCPIHVDVHTLLKLTNASVYTGGDPTNTNWTLAKPYPGLTYTVIGYDPNPGFPPLNQSAWLAIVCNNPLLYNSTIIPNGDYHVFLLLNKGGSYELYLDWYNTRLLVKHNANIKPALPWLMECEYGITVENLASISHLVVNKYVYFDGVLLPDYPEDLTIDAYGHVKELLNLNVSKMTALQNGRHNVTVRVHIKGPATLDDPVANPFISQWINFTLWTETCVLEDVGGITYYDLIGYPAYPYINTLPILRVSDGKVRVDDVLAVATSFGSNPGDTRWDSPCDINRDYKVRVDDVLLCAQMFGAG